MEILIFLAVGIIVGILAGLFGVGGGLIIVPVLSLVYLGQGFEQNIIQLAIGTSLTTIIFTSISSIIAHQKHQAVLWHIWRQLFLGLIVGGVVGAYLVTQVSDGFLSKFFAIFEIVVGIKIWCQIQVKPAAKPISTWLANIAGVVISFVSTLVGIGGGTMSVPFLLWHQIKMPQAVATAAAIGLPIAIVSSLSFIVFGFGTPNLPQYSFGLVHLPALGAICVASVIFAPVGAKLAHKINPIILQKSFAILLLGLGLKMLWI